MTSDSSTGSTSERGDATLTVAETKPSPTPPLLARDSELATVEHRIRCASSGHGGGIYLTGGPGAGKTRFLTEIARRSPCDDSAILRCSGSPGERAIPFAGLHQLLYPLRTDMTALPSHHCATLERVFGLSEPMTDWVPVSCAALALLEVATKRSPVLLLVDDAHHLDHATLDILAFASRRLQNMPVTMVIAARETDFILNRMQSLPWIRLDPLSPNDIHQVVLSTTGAASQDIVDRLAAESDGNPLIVTELTAALTPGMARGDEELPEELPTSPRVHASFGGTLAELPTASQRLLLIAAANDETDLYSTLSAATSLDLDLADLTAAERSGLIRVTDEELRFQPPLLRSVLYRNATFAERRSVHLALARATANTPHRQAHHLFVATHEPDEELVHRILANAGHERQVKGMTSVLRSLERAATLSRDPTTRARLLIDAAACAWQAGLPMRARTLEKQATGSDSNPHLTATTGLLNAAMAYTETTASVAHRILVDSIDRSHDVDTALVTQLLTLAARSALSCGDSAELTRICHRLLDLGLAEDDPLIEFAAALRRLADRDLRGSAELNDATVALLGRLSPTQPTVWPAVLPYVPSMGNTAREAYVHAVTDLRRQGATGMLPLAATPLLLLHIVTGRWDEAAALGEELLALTDRTGQRATAARVRASLTLLAGSRGDIDACEELANRIPAESVRGADLAAVATAHWGRARAALSIGDPRAALLHLNRVGAEPADAISSLIAFLAIPDLVECHIRLGQDTEAEEVLRACDRWQVDVTTGHLFGPLLRARALVTSSTKEAERLLIESIGHCREYPFERGRAELQLGKLLRRERRIKEARRFLHAAVASFESLPAHLWVGQAAAELRAAGFGSRSADDDAPPPDFIADSAGTAHRPVGQSGIDQSGNRVAIVDQLQHDPLSPVQGVSKAGDQFPTTTVAFPTVRRWCGYREHRAASSEAPQVIDDPFRLNELVVAHSSRMHTSFPRHLQSISHRTPHTSHRGAFLQVRVLHNRTRLRMTEYGGR